MKEDYELRFRTQLMRRVYTVIRVDGHSFKNYTKGLKKPFDPEFMEDMDKTAKFLCEDISGSKMAYVQSDEISIIMTDFDDISTQAWFDYDVQKLVSISASKATLAFNKARLERMGILKKWAEFDSRVFQLPSLIEVKNYLMFRQRDFKRNSISTCARILFSQSELKGKNGEEMISMMLEKGFDWSSLDSSMRLGRIIVKSVDRERPEWKRMDTTTSFSAVSEDLDAYLVPKKEVNNVHSI